MSRRNKRRHYTGPVMSQTQSAPVAVAPPPSTPRPLVPALPVGNSQRTMAHRVIEKLQLMGIRTPAPSGDGQSGQLTVPAAVRPGGSPVPTFNEQKQQALARGMENQKFYVLHAQKTGQPWFQHPRHGHQYSEFVYVTPEMAEQLLEHNDNVRPVTKSQMEAYARDIENDHWIPSAESISISVEGKMIDGQHRAQGIVSAERALPIYMTFNVPIEAKFVADSGKKRTVNDRLGILFTGESRLNKKAPALCRALMSGAGPRPKWTDTEIGEFILVHEEAIRWVIENLPKQRSDVQAAFAKAYLWWGPGAIQDFCHALTNIEFKADTPPSILYQWLQKVGPETSGETVYRKTVQAIRHHVEKKDIFRLYEATEDIFEWGPNWSVPPRS
jgi:hypothetical protein